MKNIEFIKKHLALYIICLIKLILIIAMIFGEGNFLFCLLLGLELAADVYVYLCFIRPMEDIQDLIHNQKFDLAKNEDYELEKLKIHSQNTEFEGLVNYIIMVLKSSYDSKMLRTEAEMRAFQSQINPHFLYNTLDTIRGQAIICHADNVARMTEALANIFRYSISAPSDIVSIRSELKNTDDYILIQKYRFPKKFAIVKEIEDEDVLDNCMIPMLTIQPLIENAVNHGFEKISENGLIKIRIFSTQSSMKIIVTDNGQGISQSKLESIIKALKNDTHILMNSSESQTHTGIALYNINKRLKFYYGEKYGLNIYSTEKVGTSVELILPLLNKESLHD